MNAKIALCVLSLIFLSRGIWGGQAFKKLESWKHDVLIPSMLFDATVNKDGDLIAAFQKTGVKVANASNIGDLGPFGQGPGDLDGFFTLCFYKGDLAVEGMAGKIKVFHKKSGTYAWKQTVWKQVGPSYHLVSDGKFLQGKWFFSGADTHKTGSNTYKTYFIKVYDEQGKYITSLIEEKNRVKNRQYRLLNYHLAVGGGKLLFIPEHEPLLKVIDPGTLKVEREIILKTPPYYKPMPRENYLFSEAYKKLSVLEIQKTWARWKTNYSRIGRVAVDGNHLVLQIRTCSAGLKRFALLFYNTSSFSLDRVILTDDLLLAVKDGRYYLFENGNPGYDEEAGDFIVNIYGFVKNK